MLRSTDYKGVNVVEEKGAKIFRLLSGDPNIYEGGWDIPTHIKNAAIEAIKNGYNMYPHRLPGISDRLISAIVSWEKKINSVSYNPVNVIPTQGVSGGLKLLYSSVLKPGDEIILSDPTYPPYITGIMEHKGRSTFFKKIEEEEWLPDIDDLRRKISKRTKGIVIIHPNNPTGALYSEKTLKKILSIAGEQDIPVISDEIYGQFIYDDRKFRSLAALADDVPCIIMNSLSKAYVLTGWRIGHIAVNDPQGRVKHLTNDLETNKSIAGSIPTPLVYGAIAAYEGSTDHVSNMLKELAKRRDYTYKRLNQIPGISTTKPRAAFFMFPKIHAIGKKWEKDNKFTQEFRESKHIALSPGSNYGDTWAKGHIRIPYLPSIETLDIVLNKLEDFLKESIFK